MKEEIKAVINGDMFSVRKYFFIYICKNDAWVTIPGGI